MPAQRRPTPVHLPWPGLRVRARWQHGCVS